MGKRIRLVLLIVLTVIFLGCCVSLLSVLNRYREEDRLYDEIAETYLREAENGGPAETSGEALPQAPIEVDFAALQEVCGDVVGWIYCEDTPINYPVVQVDDNDYYLRRDIEGNHSTAGTIFVDGNNRKGFLDSNMIIYGHHMRNGSMFACLENWEEQEYYEEHPVMWLLTPEQDYQIVLFSGYTTSATSDTYTIFTDPCEQLDRYLQDCIAKSDFQADVAIDGTGRYVVLSTCAYEFDDARHVLHGMLVPAAGREGAAGGSLYGKEGTVHRGKQGAKKSL